ncbi:MAG: ParB/RepB/Spo0J family partition protein [Bacteroidetes bacterium]|nr:ParB/RepB/Spo0J family partition protein [Bacteroidota bacterium]
MSKRKEALGKGIRALLQNIDEDTEITRINPQEADSIINTIAKIPLEDIEVNPFQPRADFNKEALKELSDSIKVHGVIQPVTVRKVGPGKYQLIAGERRLRASKIAGFHDIPAYVRAVNDQEALEIALIENIQREDLNSMEIAINYQRLIDECDLTHDNLGERLGKNRSTVTNYLRLLKLPPVIQDGLKDRQLSMGHARTLISIPEAEKQLYAFNEIRTKGLSVRKAEELVRLLTKGTIQPKLKRSPSKISAALKRIESGLMDRFETKVRIKQGKGDTGEIVIPFYSDSDLERIIDLIGDE